MWIRGRHVHLVLKTHTHTHVHTHKYNIYYLLHYKIILCLLSWESEPMEWEALVWFAALSVTVHLVYMYCITVCVFM